MAAQRVKSANQRSVRAHFTALRAEKYAGAILLLPQRRALTIDSPCRTELSCAFASRAGKTRDFIRIKLNMLVLTATGATSANIAKRSIARRNGGLFGHQATISLAVSKN